MASSIVSYNKSETNDQTSKPETPQELIFRNSQGIIFKQDEKNSSQGIIVGYEGEVDSIDKKVKLSIPTILKDIKNNNINLTATVIDEKAFENKKISYLDIPSLIEKISSFVFRCSGISTLNFQEKSNLKIIGYNAFEDHNLENISLPESLTHIYDNAFWSTNNKIENQTINFNNNLNLTEISKGTFMGMKFQNIDLPKNVKLLKRFAFYYDDWNINPAVSILNVNKYNDELIMETHNNNFGIRTCFGNYKTVKINKITK